MPYFPDASSQTVDWDRLISRPISDWVSPILSKLLIVIFMSITAIIGTPIFTVNRYSYLYFNENIGMSIGTRIKEARIEKDLTQKQLAAKVGIKQPTLSELERGDSAGTTMVASFAAALGVNALWLETGKGEKHAPQELKKVIAVDEDDKSFIQIRKVKLRLSAGITGFLPDQDVGDDSSISIPRKWIEAKGLFAENLLAVKVRGESMSPSLNEGDTVVINTADIKPSDGIVFAVNYEGEAVIKRLSRDAGEWWLISDNPDQRKYHRKICRGNECIIIGRVVRKESDVI